MISDILSDAIARIEEQQEHDNGSGRRYDDAHIKREIEITKSAMRELILKLDHADALQSWGSH